MFKARGPSTNLKELLLEKIDLYLTKDNPPPKTTIGKWLDKREKFRLRGTQYFEEITNTRDVILLEKVYNDYVNFNDDVSSLGSSVKLRDRIGEAFCEFFDFSKDDICQCRYADDFQELVKEHLNRGGDLDNVHILCIGMLVYDKIDFKMSEYISQQFSIN